MAEPFLGEIRLMSFGFPPKGWALCDGQLLPINQNQALFSLLGTTFGGNGQTNFALPDLRARTAIHMGGSHTLGERGGAASHTLTTSELPTHTHGLQGSQTAAETNVPSTTAYLGAVNNTYTPPTQLVALSADEVGRVGGGQAHQNMQPFLTLSFCIALQGIFPSPN